MHNSQLESYLDALEKAQSSLPAEARQEWRVEARQHLLDIASAHEQRGMAPEEAVEAALRKFGDPEQIGRQMARCPVNTPLEGKAAVVLFSGPMIAVMVLLIVLAYAYVDTDSRLLFVTLQVSGVGAFLAIPILGGWRIGRRLLRRQSNQAVLRALALTGIGFLPIASVLLIPAFGSPFHGAQPDLRWGVLWFPITWLSMRLAQRNHQRLNPI